MTIDWTQVRTAEDVAAEARAAAEAEVCAAVDAAGDAIAGRYPRTERDTWGAQEAAARAWLADPEASDPPGLALLGAIAAARGSAIADLVPTIVAKADAWRVAGGTLAGIRAAAFEGIAAAGTPQAVEAARDAGLAGIAALLAAAAGG